MFVRSRMSRDMVYRKGGKEFIIKAGTVSSVDENIVSARELKSLYGSRIDIISRGLTSMDSKKEPKVEAKKLNKLAPKKPEPPKKLDSNLINNILDELKDEEKKKEEKTEAPKKVVKKRTARKTTSRTRKTKKQ